MQREVTKELARLSPVRVPAHALVGWPLQVWPPGAGDKGCVQFSQFRTPFEWPVPTVQPRG